MHLRILIVCHVILVCCISLPALTCKTHAFIVYMTLDVSEGRKEVCVCQKGGGWEKERESAFSYGK